MDVRIEQALPEPARRAAAELYWEAFGRLLRPALGSSPRAVDVLLDGLDADRAIVAMDGDELVGLVGLHYGGRPFTRLRARSLVRHLGIAGIPRLVPLALLAGRPSLSELRIDGIAVRDDRRGHGIGARLLREAAGRARAVGIDVLRLEVVDTNPRARALYEREGFVAVRTEHTPYLRRAMGFGAVTTMERRVG